MKIALIGYGKMGRAIEQILLQRGHTIGCIIDVDTPVDAFNSADFSACDVAIEFTCPAAAVANYAHAFAAGVPVVSGTTGWPAAHLAEVKQLIEAHNATLLWTSNFSIGVNLFMKVNAYLAHLMEAFPQYAPAMKEIHHIHKLDHPSGTAITLAEGIIANNNRIDSWAEPTADSPITAATVLPIEHERVGEVPGTHIVTWQSDVDAITIEHRAASRMGFAMGAVMAAEWVASNPQRRGLLGMEVLFDNL
jgi:4-hydroxy-tetrahydrodipicolinate reductase